MSINKLNKTVAFYTLGCKVNQYETEVIKKDFLDNNYIEVDFEEKSDVYVINTCTVTSVADKKNRKMIRRAITRNPESKLIVTGCYAQTNIEELKEIKEIDYIIGNAKKENVYEIFSRDLSNYQVDNIFDEKEYSSRKFTILRDKARAFVKIQDGCNKFCSYCKIPYARGLSRSRSSKDIIEEVTYLVKEGYREIVITGINMSEYGIDLEESINFDDIVEQILEVSGIERVRVSSVYPDTLSDRFIQMLSTNSKLMPHLHISVQSLDDEILRLMKRKYNAQYVVEKLQRVQKLVPEVSLTADIIVGFPRETEECFQNTLNNIKKINFSDLHVFPYSDREKTAALLIDGKIDSKVKKERVKRIQEMNDLNFIEFRKNQIGKVHKVYIEEINKGLAIGYTENYLKTYVNVKEQEGIERNIKISDVVTVKIIGFDKMMLEGEIL